MSTDAKPYTMDEASESPYFPDDEGIPGSFTLGPDMRIASSRRIRATVQQVARLEAECLAAENLLIALQEQMARMAAQHVESTKRLVAEAREEQREACAVFMADDKNDKTASAWFAAKVRATPLESTPLADALAEEKAKHQETQRQLEAVTALTGELTPEVWDRLSRAQGYIRCNENICITPGDDLASLPAQEKP